MQEKQWNDKIKLGNHELKNRAVMAALTRMRADPSNGIPTELFVEYYSQRAGSGLILSEASSWSQRGITFPGAGNIFSKEQAEGWKKVTDAVHQKGGKIFIQIFHGGRAAHSTLNGGLQTFGPSAIAIEDKNYFARAPQEVPKEMTLEDIKETQEEFRRAVINAKEAGFDGVQVHGAHGYLVDSFIRSSSNKRTDHYGGSAENRGRFALELIDIALQYFSPEEVGIKFSPVTPYNSEYDENPIETYSYLMQELDKRNIGFVELREPSPPGVDHRGHPIVPSTQIENVSREMRKFYKGIIIANDSFDSERGLEFIRNGWADMISFGRLYISNPDLAERLDRKQKLNTHSDVKTFYSNFKPEGYIDYPFHDEWIKTQQ